MHHAKAANGRLCLFLCALLFLFGGGHLPALAQPPQPVRVLQVLDGDTCHIELRGRRETLRLFGVDTPELGRDGAPDQYYAREARDTLRALTAAGGLTLLPAPRPRDDYNRLLGALQLPDGSLVNTELVRLGVAFCLPHPREGDWLAAQLLAAQREAMDQGRGFWPHILGLDPGPGVVGSRKSLRFFTPGCRDADQLGRNNRVPFAGLAEAFRTGFAPARHCGFWPAP